MLHVPESTGSYKCIPSDRINKNHVLQLYNSAPKAKSKEALQPTKIHLVLNEYEA